MIARKTSQSAKLLFIQNSLSMRLCSRSSFQVTKSELYLFLSLGKIPMYFLKIALSISVFSMHSPRIVQVIRPPPPFVFLLIVWCSMFYLFDTL